MDITAIVGPMGAGKTTEAIERFREDNVIVYDFLNTRNSERDLRNVLKRSIDSVSPVFHHLMESFSIPKSVALCSCPPIIMVDELHFVDVFKKRDEFMDFLGRLVDLEENDVSVIVAGIYYDFYNNYEVFPVWHDLNDFAHRNEFGYNIIHLPSLTPCHFCKGEDRVYFTANVSGNNERVGDHYVNVCHSCKGKALGSPKSRKQAEGCL